MFVGVGAASVERSPPLRRRFRQLPLTYRCPLPPSLPQAPAAFSRSLLRLPTPTPLRPPAAWVRFALQWPPLDEACSAAAASLILAALLPPPPTAGQAFAAARAEARAGGSSADARASAAAAAAGQNKAANAAASAWASALVGGAGARSAADAALDSMSKSYAAAAVTAATAAHAFTLPAADTAALTQAWVLVSLVSLCPACVPAQLP